MQKVWLFNSEVPVPQDLDGTTFFSWRDLSFCGASPVSPALTHKNALLLRFKGAPCFFSSWTSSWSVTLHISLSVASAPPSCSLVLTVPFCFSSRVASCRKYLPPCGGFYFFFFLEVIITNAHQLTGTRLDLFINSLWFNSLTLLPCYANGCGQSTTPPCWGLDR